MRDINFANGLGPIASGARNGTLGCPSFIHRRYLWTGGRQGNLRERIKQFELGVYRVDHHVTGTDRQGQGLGRNLDGKEKRKEVLRLWRVSLLGFDPR
ncbi:hypothetical protein BO70DRAFT_209562 [Aspergillus heteromorphus CBS 117.55]|uniref:Uncharacterized protein n=1 Tax=Aspergillus heteromorphus CBS 117.55 TaxID=1448321 RepID=A0A317WK25_9EURO|nr:uncharacterized protein BO70DRAFT_209562 [Aspergillus heteromorphus CBS 117.55]PWY86679.1 hypothetical protein BO70DRAFT_209562 [Aspergillus heteromorphus CBS 117.55]